MEFAIEFPKPVKPLLLIKYYAERDNFEIVFLFLKNIFSFALSEKRYLFKLFNLMSSQFFHVYFMNYNLLKSHVNRGR